MKFENIKRIYFHYKDLDKDKVAAGEAAYDKQADKYVWVEPEHANLVSSIINEGQPNYKDSTSKHAPVIDFDIPIEVYPSSRLGHHHLYINKAISWEDYQLLLTTLSKVGLVEAGYTGASIANGFSAVRPVGVVKPNAPKGIEVLKENALLRQEIYKLKAELLEAQNASKTITHPGPYPVTLMPGDTFVLTSNETYTY